MLRIVQVSVRVILLCIQALALSSRIARHDLVKVMQAMPQKQLTKC